MYIVCCNNDTFSHHMKKVLIIFLVSGVHEIIGITQASVIIVFELDSPFFIGIFVPQPIRRCLRDRSRLLIVHIH